MAGIDHNPFSFGKITTTAGTPVSLTSNFASDELVVAAPMSYVSIQSLPTNTGDVYIGYPNMNKTTLAGVIAIIGPGESAGFGHPNTATIYPRDIYIDVETSAEGVLAYGYQY